MCAAKAPGKDFLRTGSGLPLRAEFAKLTLLEAVAQGATHIAKIFIEAKDWGELDSLGQNVVHLIVRHDVKAGLIGLIAKVELITWQSIGTHPFNAIDTSDQKATPLIRAAALGRTGHALALIKNRAPVVGKDQWGRTALHYAIMRGDRELAEALILTKTYRIPDNSGRTAQDYLKHPEWCKDALASYDVKFSSENLEKMGDIFPE